MTSVGQEETLFRVDVLAAQVGVLVRPSVWPLRIGGFKVPEEMRPVHVDENIGLTELLEALRHSKDFEPYADVRSVDVTVPEGTDLRPLTRLTRLERLCLDLGSRATLPDWLGTLT